MSKFIASTLLGTVLLTGGLQSVATARPADRASEHYRTSEHQNHSVRAFWDRMQRNGT